MDEGHTRSKTTMKNATNYIEEAIRFKRTTAPDTLGTHRAFDVFSGTSSLEVLERVLQLLDKTGIPYSYNHDFYIHVGTGSMNCTIEIYSNKGAHAKTRSQYSIAKAPIIPEMDTYIIAMWDTTRFFGPLFRHIVENYSAEVIPPFTYRDTSFSLYCPEDHEMDRAAKFAEECQTLAVGGLTKLEVAILLQQPVESD
jgi:hypothetical protein